MITKVDHSVYGQKVMRDIFSFIVAVGSVGLKPDMAKEEELWHP